MSEAKKRKGAYDARYIKANIRQRTLSFNRNNPEDMEMYDWIGKQENATQYLKSLVREDIKKSLQK